MADRIPSRRPAAHPRPELRRRHSRISLIWSGQLEAGETSVPCAIMNLSEGGALLRCPDETAWPTQADAAPVELESARFGKLKGRVIWRKGHAIGLAFQDAQRSIAECLTGTVASRAAPAFAG